MNRIFLVEDDNDNNNESNYGKNFSIYVRTVR